MPDPQPLKRCKTVLGCTAPVYGLACLAGHEQPSRFKPRAVILDELEQEAKEQPDELEL